LLDFESVTGSGFPARADGALSRQAAEEKLDFVRVKPMSVAKRIKRTRERASLGTGAGREAAGERRGARFS